MNKILKFFQFINEKYQLDPNDPPEMNSQKKGFNDIEMNIKDYQVNKVKLDNIYKTYTSDKDLISKLKAQKLIEGNPDNYKTIKFINPLLSIHAQISRKMREITDIQKLVKSDEQTLDNKEEVAGSGGDKQITDAIEDDITQVEDKISSKNDQITKLNSEIIVLKKQIDLEINKMKKQLIDSQRRINTEQFT